jgi:hypothetical protein
MNSIEIVCAEIESIKKGVKACMKS